MKHAQRLLWVLAGLLFAVPAGAVTTLKIATLAPDGTQWMSRVRAAGEEVGTRTQGRVQFKFYPGGVMGNDEAVLRKIRAGQLHGAMFSAGALGQIAPEARLYGQPLLFNSYEEVGYVRARVDPAVERGFAQAGFVSFGLADGGFAHLFSIAAVGGIDELQGRKVWVPPNDPVSRAVFDVVGISPVVLPLADVMTGLQTGMIDTVASSPVGAIALQWHTRLKYMTDTPLLYLYGAMLVERRTIDKLTPADQAAVGDALRKAFTDIDRQGRADHQAAREALRKQGVAFVPVAPDKLGAWQAAALRARERLARDGGTHNEKLMAALQAHLAEFRRQAASPRR
jgi:TRAP-type C4-dicarboxylate transport system substrate-binding protein